VSAYRRVTYADRCQIFALISVKKGAGEISQLLGFDRSSIYREIKRNKQGARYRPKEAQAMAKVRLARCRKTRLLRGEAETSVLEKLEQRWSPEQISKRLRREKRLSISHETIYRYIRARPEQRAEWKRLLRRQRRGGLPRRGKKPRPEWMLPISERPKIVAERKRYGDWERDTMYGSNGRMLLVCTERKSRLLKIATVKLPVSVHLTSQTEDLLKAASYRQPKTITNDNGGELLDGFALKIPVYYCAPRRPDQRGTVENSIGLLRQYLPRGTDLAAITAEEIQNIESALNHRPRKCLDWRTPHEVFFGTSVALAS